MKHHTLSPSCDRGHRHSGRMPEALADRWSILKDLTRSAPDLGLTDRHLTVMRALLSCFPDVPEHGLIVFASNATLSERAGGMEERTLRRHISKLVDLGLVLRRDSPNRKRYLRRARGPLPSTAFGFDMSPLFAARGRLARAAEARDLESAVTARLREELSLLRRDLCDRGADETLTDEIRKCLRRVPNKTLILDLISRAKAMLDTMPPPVASASFAEDLTGSDGQDVRHHHKRSKDLPESCARKDEPATEPDSRDCREKRSATEAGQSITPLPDSEAVRTHCPEAMSFAAEPPRGWHGLFRHALMLAPMIGIGRDLVELGLRRLGQEGFALVTLCLCQRIGQIERPGAYLRSLCTGADPEGAPMRVFRDLVRSSKRAERAVTAVTA